jgi:methylated-DNA-protein-cysteine methyltransferase-like protein
MPDPFYQNIITTIRKIPAGRVATYGQVAARAGNHLGARQVARVLHASSRKHGLPWHRVINKKGMISLPVQNGYRLQKRLLKKEGVRFDSRDRIDLRRFGWRP